MKRYTSVVAMILLASTTFTFAGNRPSGVGANAAGPQLQPQLKEQNMYNEADTIFGKPDIAGDGIQNARQVDNPADIGGGSPDAVAPVPQPTVGDVGVQNAK